MLRTWWRRWTGLTELEQRIKALAGEKEAVRHMLLNQCNALERASAAEIQRMIGDIGSLERQVRALGAVPETILSDGPAYAPQEERMPADDPIPPPTHRYFAEAAAALLHHPPEAIEEWRKRNAIP